MYWYLYIYNSQATVFGNPFLVATKRNPYEIAKKNPKQHQKMVVFDFYKAGYAHMIELWSLEAQTLNKCLHEHFQEPPQCSV